MASLLGELPEYTLGYPLNAICNIALYFLLPSFCELCIYTTLISSDLALVYAHIAEDNPRWGSTTLLLMFAPSVAVFVFTVSIPNRWPSEKPFTRENLRFLALNLWHLFFFPFAAMYRYIHQIFWSIEAMCAEYSNDHDRRENALRILLKPNSMEMYFFLQAYLHSAPQIFLQFFILFRETNDKQEIASLQILSIVCSLFRMAATTASYQRFERRKVLGAHYPWVSKRMLDVSQRASAIEPSQYKEVVAEVAPTHYEPPPTGIRMLPIIEESYLTADAHCDEDEGAFEEPLIERDQDFIGTAKSSNSTLYEEPVDLRNTNVDVVGARSPTVSFVGSPVQIRRNPFNDMRDEEDDEAALKGKIVDMTKHVTPPSAPAPRPMSMAAIKERLVQNANAFIEQIPQRRYKEYNDGRDQLDGGLPMPVRRRRTVVKGVERDDGVSRLVAFWAWFLFVAARALVLCTFAHFHARAFVGVCLGHCALALALLLWNSWASATATRRAFYAFLAYAYLFCLLELKVAFRRVRLWYGGFFALCALENFALTVAWYGSVSGGHVDWWFRYILFATFVCSFLSLACFVFYFMLLKPRPVIVYKPPADEAATNA